MANVMIEPTFKEIKLSLHTLKTKKDVALIFVALIDYIWVITIYATSAFIVAVIIDGHILRPFNYDIIKKTSTFKLAVEVIIQIAIQGFIAIILHGLLELIPSPADNIYGYSSNDAIGNLVRNPAMISVILFALSRSLQGKLMILFSRFNRNALLETTISLSQIYGEKSYK